MVTFCRTLLDTLVYPRTKRPLICLILRFYVGNKAMEEKCLNELSFYQQQEVVRKFEHCCCIINF